MAGTYNLVVKKSGYTFSLPAATVVIGPSSIANVILATAPLSLSQPTTVTGPTIIK
jgi:hypothetical protein